MKVYRIRKERNGRPAPGVGLKLLRGLDLHPLNDSVTMQTPANRFEEGEVVLNYGRSSYPRWADRVQFINEPGAVGNAADKRITLRMLRDAGIPCLESTENIEEAREWINNGFKVMNRRTARGKKGNGASVAETLDELVEAQLYTKFFPKTHEFRIHVFNDEVIDYVQKKRVGKARREREGIELDRNLRNHRRGWVFAHNDIIHDENMKTTALQAVAELGLDYGAVDMLARVRKVDNSIIEHVVCEVNSAPGMSATVTRDAYLNAIRRYLENIQ